MIAWLIAKFVANWAGQYKFDEKREENERKRKQAELERNAR